MLDALHRQLAALDRDRLTPRLPTARWRAELDAEHALRRLEGEVIETERAAIAHRLGDVPTAPDAFLAWYEELKASGPGQNDPLFPWLATSATAAQVRWFLHQEVAGEAGFEDLVALTQLKLPPQPKLELARNYWDEMGRGTEGGMHGPMLERLAEATRLGELAGAVPVVWESLALGNIMLGLASNRRYAYQALGALGAIELTAPTRAVHVDAALVRLDLAPNARHYFALHATLDVKHSAAWNAEVLRPLVASVPGAAVAIAEGALLRLEAGRRCYDRYRRELNVTSQPLTSSAGRTSTWQRSPTSSRSGSSAGT
jgi:hypothetical protein